MIVVWSGGHPEQKELPPESRRCSLLQRLRSSIPLSGSFPAVASRWLIHTGRGDLHLLGSGEVAAVTPRAGDAVFLWRDSAAGQIQEWLAARGGEARTWFAPSPGAQGEWTEFVCLEWRPGSPPREPHHEILALRVHDADRLRALQAPWLWEYYGSPEALLAEADAYGAWDGGELISAAVCAMSAGGYADLSVATAPHRRRTGAATDACAALIEHLNARGLRTVWNTSADHTASLNLAERLGFVPAESFHGRTGRLGREAANRPQDQPYDDGPPCPEDPRKE